MVSCPDSRGATHTFGETRNLNFGAVTKRLIDFSLLQGEERFLDISLKNGRYIVILNTFELMITEYCLKLCCNFSFTAKILLISDQLRIVGYGR